MRVVPASGDPAMAFAFASGPIIADRPRIGSKAAG
jgi:hypothetical protein